MINKTKITVYDYGTFTHHRTEPIVYKDVDAWCLQGETGFLAFFIIDDTLFEAHGDDGHWWVAGRMHTHWIDELKEVVMSIAR
jgi:hypothetical protein